LGCNQKTVWWALIMVLALVQFFIGMPACAQQQSTQNPPPPPDTQPKAAGTTTPIAVPATDDAASDVPPANPGPVDPFAGEIKQVGTGLPLTGTSTTPLRWGDFSVADIEYIGIHDQFIPARSASTPWTNITMLRAALMFDHYIKKNRIVLQYLPQLAILSGQIHANAGANNNVGFGMTFNLTPRLTMTLQDTFTQVHSNQLIPEKYLAADAFAGAVVQNNFLDTNGSFIADTATATFQYGLSPRTTLTVSPMFRYAQATTNQANYGVDGNTYQGVVTLGYALTPHRSVGFLGSYQLLKQSTGGLPTSAKFFTTGAYYSEQLARSLWITASAGGQYQSYSDLPGAGQWGLATALTLVESFSQKVGLTLAYNRGTGFNNYLTTSRSDRVDAAIGLHLISRFSWNNGGGYYRELGSDPRTNGKYLSTSGDFQLTKDVSAFSSFTYSFQNSNTPQLLSGLRRTLSWGIRWQPPLNVAH